MTGAASCAELARLLDVRPEGPCSYLGAPAPDRGRRVVEGSQMLAQALVASCRHVPDRRVVSSWMGFLRVADPALPLRFDLEELSHGRTFAARGVEVRQEDRLCASGQVLLDVTAADLVRHAEAPPEVPGPEEGEPLEMGITGQEVRTVGGAYTGDPEAPAGPPQLDAWLRFGDPPDDPVLHVALLAQFSGYLSIAAALRPHPGVGQDQAHRSLSTAVNAISLSMHAPVHAERWMLVHHRSTFAGDGMTRSACRVHDESGSLLASFSVDGMVRARERTGIDPSRAL